MDKGESKYVIVRPIRVVVTLTQPSGGYKLLSLTVPAEQIHEAGLSDHKSVRKVGLHNYSVLVQTHLLCYKHFDKLVNQDCQLRKFQSSTGREYLELTATDTRLTNYITITPLSCDLVDKRRHFNMYIVRISEEDMKKNFLLHHTALYQGKSHADGEGMKLIVSASDDIDNIIVGRQIDLLNAVEYLPDKNIYREFFHFSRIQHKLIRDHISLMVKYYTEVVIFFEKSSGREVWRCSYNDLEGEIQKFISEGWKLLF